jgi:hypothetical protein
MVLVLEYFIEVAAVEFLAAHTAVDEVDFVGFGSVLV